MKKIKYKIDFLRWTKFFALVSTILIVISAISIYQPGLNRGIDFTGGTQLRVQFVEEVPTAEVRAALGEAEVRGFDLTKSAIQDFPDLPHVKTITLPITAKDDIDKTLRALEKEFPGLEVLSREVIGGAISQELITKGWQTILLALIVILIYISWRFRLRYAVGAVAALIHDVMIALGIFALFQVEINLPIIAAFLTIIGYSLNDTIVIFDRVRENRELMRKATYYDVINKSINQSLSRTIQTSLTTLIPVVILFFFGGSVLRAFSLALLIGVIVGTYSSIYIANPIVYWWSLKAEAKR
jgi:preprotein translocase subunit SecF